MANLHVDTQLLAYAYNADISCTQQSGDIVISSVAAKEFLLAYKVNSAQDLYYLPAQIGLNWRLSANAFSFGIMRDHPFSKHYTDQRIIDIQTANVCYIEYGSLAFSMAINNKSIDLFRSATSHLPKHTRRLVKSKFEFLCDNKIECKALNDPTVELAINIMRDFLKHYQPKKNFRNTLNDILILSAAAADGALLQTNDTLLDELSNLHTPHHKFSSANSIFLDYTNSEPANQKENNGSKGYVNKPTFIYKRDIS